jgi:DNA-binding transcriptional ArsR family regulator
MPAEVGDFGVRTIVDGPWSIVLLYYIHHYEYDEFHLQGPRDDDIFKIMNISSVESVSDLFQAIGPAARIQILLAIGAGETCVCHLEAMLGLRQAALSQHLMTLRQAGIVSGRRHGRYIHYRLRNPSLLTLIQQAAEMQKVTLPELAPSPQCCCPDCEKESL